jgi:quercetin dioxygenase-like cupin family protein
MCRSSFVLPVTCVMLVHFLCQTPLALEASAKVQVKPLIKTTVSWDSSAITYPTGKPEITGLLIEIAPGAETQWHLHPVPSFAYILEGHLEVTLKDGRRNTLKAGDALVEVINTAHNGRNVGTTPVKLVVFYAGVVGQSLTVKEN